MTLASNKRNAEDTIFMKQLSQCLLPTTPIKGQYRFDYISSKIMSKRDAATEYDSRFKQAECRSHNLHEVAFTMPPDN